MRLSPQFAVRSSGHASPVAQRLAGEGAGRGEGEAPWKGWTNGGGDRASTAAQFSRLTEHVLGATHAHATPPAIPVTRVVPVAPVNTPTPAFPMDESAMLSPISAAIERMVTRGQEQLAVTVRFEHGGTLSLKLALRDGAIAAQMHTDVPGLEDALRTSWSSFAQDWSQRGVKLAAPSFSGAPAQAQADAGAGRDGQRSPGHEGRASSGAPAFPAPGLVRRPGRGGASGAGIRSVVTQHSRGPRGLRTWA